MEHQGFNAHRFEVASRHISDAAREARRARLVEGIDLMRGVARELRATLATVERVQVLCPEVDRYTAAIAQAIRLAADSVDKAE